MKNKRGLSAIVATLLIILLTLVAVGIIWFAVRNIVQGGADQIEASAKCTAVDISATDASCEINHHYPTVILIYFGQQSEL